MGVLLLASTEERILLANCALQSMLIVGGSTVRIPHLLHEIGEVLGDTIVF